MDNGGGRFSRAALIITGIILGGCCIQWLTGPFDIKLLSWPANLFAGIAMVLAAIVTALLHRSRFFRQLTGVPFSAAVICGLVVIGIVMGLVPQQRHFEIETSSLPEGFHGITTSWPFVLLYFTTMFVLMCVLIRRTLSFRWKDYAFYLNHAGLLLLLSAAGLGASDKENFTMYVYRGMPQDGAYFSSKELVGLPFSVTLDKFDIEYFPPSIIVARWDSGEPVDTGESLYLDAAAVGIPVRGTDYDATVLEYLHTAVETPNGFMEVDMPASTPAALIRLRDIWSGKQYEGWVSSGNAIRTGTVLQAGGDYRAVMAAPEPKRYISDITVDDGNRSVTRATLQVNKPLRYGQWSIYQLGYDTRAGRMSEYSILKLVYDPWLPIAYAGIMMLAAGCAVMVWTGRRKIGMEEIL